MEETRKNEPGGQPGKEKKPKRELSPKEVQQRKKMIVFPLMFLAFAGCMYLIFAPSGKDKTDVESVGGFNLQCRPPAARRGRDYSRQADRLRAGGGEPKAAGQNPVLAGLRLYA